jgi:LPXTG-motif cell wall-anchored protein
MPYAGGQNQDMGGPWQTNMDDLHERFQTTRGGGSWGGYYVPDATDSVRDMIGVYNTGTRDLPAESTRAGMLSFGLGRVSGSLMREVRETLPHFRMKGPFGPGVDPRAFGSGNQGVRGHVHERVTDLHGNVHANIRDLTGLGDTVFANQRIGAAPYTNTFGIHRLRGLGGYTGPWYENPWYLGMGAAAIIGGVWFLTRKKR